MYPFLRMTLVLRSEARKPPLGIFDTHQRSMLCLPSDADMFWEMNNGRILTFYDLGRVGLAQRTGLMRMLKAKGWGLVVAGSSVRYRARVRPFQRFDLRTRLLGWDAVHLPRTGDVAGRHRLQPRASAQRRDRARQTGRHRPRRGRHGAVAGVAAPAELGNPLDRRGYRAAMAARGLKTRHIASNAALIINI